MLDRGILVRPGLDKLAANVRELRKFELDDHEWTNASEVSKFLDPFYIISRHMEGSKYPTLRGVIKRRKRKNGKRKPKKRKIPRK